MTDDRDLWQQSFDQWWENHPMRVPGEPPPRAYLESFRYGWARSALAEPARPNLGCATTRELLEEIRVRIELDGKLEYRTVDSDETGES